MRTSENPICDLAAVKLLSPSLDLKEHYLRAYIRITDPSDRLAWLYLGDNADEELPLKDFAGYANTLLKRESEPANGFVCDTVYWAIYNDQMVGRISLRHELNAFLMREGGHIGYIVHPDWRNKGVATCMLGMVLKTERAKHIGKLLLTCDANNVASEKVILNNGGLFECEIDLGPNRPRKKRFWIDVRRLAL